jgi:hypothetical protein
MAENAKRSGIVTLVMHPMEEAKAAGTPGNKAGPAWFLEKMTSLRIGGVIAVAVLGPGVDASPLTGISVSGARAGDTVSVAGPIAGRRGDDLKLNRRPASARE